MARTTSRSLLLLLPALLLTASIILTAAIPDRGGVTGRAEGDSVESGEKEYPDFVPNGTPASYNPAELAANVIYPELARQNGMEGRVILLVYLEETGEIEKVEVLKTTPEEGKIRELFIEAAKEGVWKTKFTPALMNDKAVRYKMPVIVDFKLR